MTDDSRTSLVGQQIRVYRIVALLGAGGMGEVYRARDDRLGRDVAIKLLPPDFSRDDDRLRRFQQEARAAGQLNHPNIMAVYDVGDHEGSPYLVCELLEGDIAPPSTVAPSARRFHEYASRLRVWLAAAHEQGIVHRDLARRTFVTKGTRQDSISDFESDWLPDAPPIRQPLLKQLAGVVLGRRLHVARAGAARLPTRCADIFSLGVMLYEMLPGQTASPQHDGADT